MSQHGSNLGCIGRVLEQVGGMFLCILQRETMKATLSGSLDDQTSAQGKAKTENWYVRTIGLHDIIERNNSLNQRIDVPKAIVVQRVHIGKTNAILLCLGHEICSIDGTFHIVANASNLQNLCRGANFRIKGLIGTTELHHGCTMTMVLKFFHMHGLFDITLVCKEIKQCLHKRPQMTTFKTLCRQTHLFNSTKHERHKLSYALEAPTQTMSSFAMVR